MRKYGQLWSRVILCFKFVKPPDHKFRLLSVGFHYLTLPHPGLPYFVKWMGPVILLNSIQQRAVLKQGILIQKVLQISWESVNYWLLPRKRKYTALTCNLSTNIGKPFYCVSFNSTLKILPFLLNWQTVQSLCWKKKKKKSIFPTAFAHSVTVSHFEISYFTIFHYYYIPCHDQWSLM